MTANVIWIAAIIQRPVIRLLTSRSARRSGLVRELPRQVGGAAHRLPEQDPRDRERLLHDRGYVRERGLALGRHLLPLVADALRQPDEERQQDQREDGEPPVEQHHRDDRRDHRGHIREDRGRRRRHDRVDAADVVRDPALHVAGARAREEREREPLQVLVHRRPQVVHDGLADAVREERLVDADGAGRDRDRDHPRHEEGEEMDVVLRDRGVENAAEEEGRDHAEERGEEDQREDDRELAAGRRGRAGRCGGDALSARPDRPGARASRGCLLRSGDLACA